MRVLWASIGLAPVSHARARETVLRAAMSRFPRELTARTARARAERRRMWARIEAGRLSEYDLG